MVETLGALIKARREAKALDGFELAYRVQRSPASVSRYEQDKQVPDYRVYRRLLAVLEVSADEEPQWEAAYTRAEQKAERPREVATPPAPPFPHPSGVAGSAPPTDAGPGPAGLEPALAGAPPERRPGLAPAELGPAAFVTRAEFDNLRTIMTRIARKVGVALGAAICAFVLTTPAAAEAPTVGARGHMTAHGASGMSLLRRWTRRAARWLTDGALRYTPCNLSPA